MNRWIGKVAVVTGASSGIGAAITKDLVKAGLIVIGLARRPALIDEYKEDLLSEKGQLHSRFCDVSNVQSVNEVFAWIEETFEEVNILVNNAAVMSNSMILNETNTIAEMSNVINTNLLGPVACTQEAFRIMKKRKIDAGHIVNINSIAGHNIPYIGKENSLNVYWSTKHGIKAFSEVIRQELVSLDNKNIRVTSISPGIVKTDMTKDGFLADCPSLKPEDVSSCVMFAIGAPSNVQIHEMIVKPVGELF